MKSERDLPRVVAEFIRPPIPVRGMDWCAWDARRCADEDGFVQGFGATKDAAIQDFWQQWEPDH